VTGANANLEVERLCIEDVEQAHRKAEHRRGTAESAHRSLRGYLEAKIARQSCEGAELEQNSPRSGKAVHRGSVHLAVS
jgi:anti-sigma factor RsiW